MKTHTHTYLSMWRYFDFTTNWEKVYAVWQSDHIQDILEEGMRKWAEPYREWIRGADLWKYCKWDNVHEEVYHRTDNYLDANDIDRIFIKRMHEILPGRRRLYTEDEVHMDPVYERIVHHIDTINEPVRGSLEAMCMGHGFEYLTDALAETAQVLFPTSSVATTCDSLTSCLVVLPDTQEIFDFGRYYLYEKEGEKYEDPETLRFNFNLDHLLTL